MSVTLEQILNDCRAESPDTFVLEKSASISETSSSNDEDVDQMVAFLKEASIPEQTTEQVPQAEQNVYEKVAEAAILNSVMQSMKGGNTKLAEFRESAINAGHSPEAVDTMIEHRTKQASLASTTKKYAPKVLAGLGIGAAATGAGYLKGKEDQKDTTKLVGRAAFSAGRKYQYSKRRALEDRRQRLRAYLQRQVQQQRK